MSRPSFPALPRAAKLLARLALDTAGNTLMLLAAAIIPILAMVGGGVDMSRSYLSQSRLQQACDSGVLAARKRLGTEAVVTGQIPSDVAAIGQKFFETNFRDGAYGTQGRSFQMTLESNYAISGEAAVKVPTAVMNIFGYDEMPISVSCEAQLSMSNTDIMMVLDVTGSMALTNPGDTKSRMETMQDTVKSFHAQLTSGASNATRIRFGFLPYSTNVNVGALLDDEWVVDDWGYQSRERITTGNEISTKTYYANWAYVSGSSTENVNHTSYAATWHPGTPGSSSGGGGVVVDDNENVIVTSSSSGGSPGWYSCDQGQPANNYTQNDIITSTDTQPFTGPPAGTRKTEHHKLTRNGTQYWTYISGSTCYINKNTFNNHIITYDKITEPEAREIKKWRYKRLNRDVTNWRNETNGCVEERDTYQITNYSNVDLTRALDLDIHTVPNGNDATKWRPMYWDAIFARDKRWDNTGNFSKTPTVIDADFINPGWMGLASCPAPARLLDTISTDDLDGYLSTLEPVGQTYHDIGMIWGGRLLSPTGLFAAENIDVAGFPTSRHMIFLTDGETAPLDLAYSSYGIEPIDARRWDEDSPFTLQETVENRFTVACNQVKNMNTTVWVIGFGTSLNPTMTQCAGAGHFFEAANATQLSEAFASIAKSIAELRITD